MEKIIEKSTSPKKVVVNFDPFAFEFIYKGERFSLFICQNKKGIPDGLVFSEKFFHNDKCVIEWSQMGVSNFSYPQDPLSVYSWQAILEGFTSKVDEIIGQERFTFIRSMDWKNHLSPMSWGTKPYLDLVGSSADFVREIPYNF